TEETQDVPRTPPPPRCTCPHVNKEDVPAQGAADAQPEAAANEASSGSNVGKVVAGAALVAVAAPVLAVAGAALALPVIGFGTGGVIGGTLAATIQSVVYGGSTCGLFSMFQAAGATIVAPTVSSAVTAAGSAVLGGKLLAEATTAEADQQGGAATNGGGPDGAEGPVQCQCAACICEVDCECDCRRGRKS
ncbi:hypothetical protein C8T65DRAFT_583141, partial [Cerioporus squamosus]